MCCPVCGGYDQKVLTMKSEQFVEDLVECTACGSSWSIQHGYVEMVVDTQKSSFLQGGSECVEADDYVWAA